MSAPAQSSYTPHTRTEIVCTKCSKTASVPFKPTPGRPVYCRECFASAPAAPRPSFNSRFTPRAAPVVERKRMMAQGRKTHFLYDARAVLNETEGGMDEKDVRAFLESLFAKGARGSTEDAQKFLEQKFEDQAVTHEQGVQLGRLIDKYSFYR